MTDFRDRIRDGWDAQLRGVLQTAAALGKKGVLVFDLDSTVFDNRPRQARIVRELGAARGIPALEKCGVEQWSSGWDLKGALVNCGLSEEEAGRLYKDAKAFWGARFFTSKYCVDDVGVPGAAEFLNAVAATGVQLAYVTGRHEEMRAGTVECFKKCGMPVPDGLVQLLMKPTASESDDDFKRVAHKQIASMGTLIAAFDNEPIHVNDYAEHFPEAMVVHLATDHSGRQVELNTRVISVPNFQI
jgi:hypothetical protein